jgi:hypothetical protein
MILGPKNFEVRRLALRGSSENGWKFGMCKLPKANGGDSRDLGKRMEAKRHEDATLTWRKDGGDRTTVADYKGKIAIGQT